MGPARQVTAATPNNRTFAARQLMSALGQKRTCAAQNGMSPLPPIATAKADFRKKSCGLPRTAEQSFSHARWEPEHGLKSSYVPI
jgi:hypothetical protein